MPAKLPPDGTRVRAATYANEDDEVPAREVAGALSTHRVEWLDLTQCYVGGVQVDPDTVRPAEPGA